MALMKRGLADSEADSEASKRAKTDDIGKIVPPGCNIFIYHAPLTWDDSTLNAIFGAYGKIVSATIMKHKNTGLSKGFGFVGYDKPQSAAAAIEAMNGFEISGKRLKVQLKSEGKVGLGGGITAVSTPAGVQGGATEHGPAGCNLFIYYCPDRWDDEELKLTFTAYGNVTSATIMKNRETGLSKCFGFVTFDNPIAAQQAIQGLNGFEVEGKRLKVELKQNKTKGMPQAGQLNQLLGLLGGGMGGGQLQLGGLGGIGVQNPNLFLGGLGGLSGQNHNLLAAQQQLLMKQQLEQQMLLQQLLQQQQIHQAQQQQHLEQLGMRTQGAREGGWQQLTQAELMSLMGGVTLWGGEYGGALSGFGGMGGGGLGAAVGFSGGLSGAAGFTGGHGQLHGW